eukprot:TRINITY_DN10357_c0_g1_i1.p1 TRINITY_DN10357_c0_g1~~TRINITY_DN10357_c0_g1_i1.p1  ORF type:complete len:315 (+),score=62.96 TRINITY_DN10357_c0_g1_i1:74-1018(+)
MAKSIKDMVRVRSSGPRQFESEFAPEKMGNLADIGFGGCVLSMAISVAHQTVPASYFLYSSLGYYLGPTLTTDKVKFTVEEIRTTKSFCTRKVQAYQKQKDVERNTFYLILEFHVLEPSLLVFHVPTRMSWPDPEECTTFQAHLDTLVKQEKIPPIMPKIYKKIFGQFSKYFDLRACPESVSTQNISGLDKHAATTQDHLTITQKTNSMWFRSSIPLESASEHYGAIAFVTDAALAFLPLTFSRMFLDDAGPVSSMDLTLHFHTSRFRADEWLLHEQHTEAGEDGRTYSVGRVYTKDRRLVATMQQMSILRVKL